MVRSFKDDYLRGLGTGGTLADVPTEVDVIQGLHGLSVLDAVYYDNVSGDWLQAQADDPATLGRWIVVEVTDVNNFKVAMAGQYTIAAHGLSVATTYYVSPTVAGGLTSTRPNPSNGEYINPIVRANDGNTIMILPFEVGQEQDYFSISTFIRSGENETMYVVYKSAFPFQVLSLDYQCSAGSIDIDVEISGTGVTGLTGLTCDGTDQTDVATALNTVAVSDNVTFVFSNDTNATGIRLNLKCLRS